MVGWLAACRTSSCGSANDLYTTLRGIFSISGERSLVGENSLLVTLAAFASVAESVSLIGDNFDVDGTASDAVA